jgi:hypothetical protein
LQAVTGWDLNSSYDPTPTQGADVIVRPNRYEPGRANIIVYDWGRSPTVKADLSSVGLAGGDRWVIRDVQNFRGMIVASGKYSSSQPVVEIPMSGLAKQQVEGWPATLPHSAPAFGTFVLEIPTALGLLPVPRGYWPLDEIGGLAADLSGGGNDLLAFGTVATPGRVNQALQFNGANSSLELSYAPQLALISDMTFSAWIRTTATRPEAIFSTFDSSQSEAGYLFKTNEAGALSLRLGGANSTSGGSVEVSDDRVVNDGNWHHCAMVISLGKDVTFYVDGKRTSSSPVATRPGTSPVPFQIGSLGYPYYANLFSGVIDEARIYGNALNDEEVALLAAGN